MGWGDNLANLTAQELSRREQARQFDLSNYVQGQQLDLQRQAARRLAQKQAFDEADRQLGGFSQLESLLPDAASHEQAQLRALIANDPEAAMQNPQFAQLREQIGNKYGPGLRDYQALLMLNQAKLAQTRHPGKDYESEAALKGYDAQVKAYWEAKKAGVKMDFPATPVPHIVNGQYVGLYDPTELWQKRAERAEEALGGFASGGIPPNPFSPNPTVTLPIAPQVPGTTPNVRPRPRPITPAPSPSVPDPSVPEFLRRPGAPQAAPQGEDNLGVYPLPAPPAWVGGAQPAPAAPAPAKAYKIRIRSPAGDAAFKSGQPIPPTEETSISVSDWGKFPGWRAVGHEQE